jgi:hypothetical protein
MIISAEELVAVREAANAILEELKLDAYLFEIEPQDSHYELLVECACESDGGWVSVSLTLPKDKMLAGFDDANIRQQLFAYWNKKLSVCKRRKD